MRSRCPRRLDVTKNHCLLALWHHFNWNFGMRVIFSLLYRRHSKSLWELIGPGAALVTLCCTLIYGPSRGKFSRGLMLGLLWFVNFFGSCFRSGDRPPDQWNISHAKTTNKRRLLSFATNTIALSPIRFLIHLHNKFQPFPDSIHFRVTCERSCLILPSLWSSFSSWKATRHKHCDAGSASWLCLPYCFT